MTCPKACAIAAAIFAIGIAGCASTTVRPGTVRSVAMARPGRVLIFDLAITDAEIRANQALGARIADGLSSETPSERELEIGHAVADTMSEDLVAGIGELGLRAVRSRSPDDIRPGDVVVFGHFLDIDEGNRLRRLVIGFGAGGSTVDARLEVITPLDGQLVRLLEFTTHADSGHMPGAAATMGVGAAAQGGVTAGMAAANAAAGGIKAYRSEIEQMAGRSADQAVAYLSEYFAHEGWIAPDKVKKAKVQ